MQSEEKKIFTKKRIIGILVYAVLLLATVLIINLDAVNNWILGVLRLLRPILIGLGLAYVCNPLFRLYEHRLLFKLRPMGLRRTVSLILTYLSVLLLLALLLLLILPRLLDSIVSFAVNYEQHLTSAIAQMNTFIEKTNELASVVTGTDTLITPIDRTNFGGMIIEWWNTNRDEILGKLSSIDIKPIADVIGNAVSLLTDTIFGIFISLYLLSTKEKRYAQVMKLRRALFGNSFNQHITRFCRVADRSFGAFIEGKLLASVIVGVLAWAIISLFRIPYALLIAAIIAVCNMIPMVGPLIGAVPTALILLLTAPAKVIPFLFIIIVIQQIDSNIISPKILGSNTGVSSLCVVIAVATMGHLWGLIGMVLGVPLFATVLDLIEHGTTERLQKKGMPSGLENYYAGDSLVDPAINAHSSTDKSVQKLERTALHIEKKLAAGETPKRRERFWLFVYRMAHKYHIINDLSDESAARFAAAEAAADCHVAADELIGSIRSERSAPADTNEE